MNRKTLIIIASVVVVALVGVGVFVLLSKKTLPTTAGPVSVFPGGSSANFPGTGNNGGPTQSTQKPYVPGSGAPMPRLYELHSLPVAGVGIYETGKGAALSVSSRYIERGLGNIFETNLGTLAENRISNETRPRLAEAFWGNAGKSVVTRFLDSDGAIKTHIINIGSFVAGPLVSTTTPTQQSTFLKTEEVFLPDDIAFVSPSGDNGDSMFFLETYPGSLVGLVSNYINTKTANVFESSFSEWLPQMPNPKLVTLTTKPSALVPGHLFFVDTNTKASTKILGGINDLTTLTNTDGTWVLYSETVGGVPQLSVYDVAKKTTRGLAQQSLADKCVWSTKVKTLAYCAVPQALSPGSYPDQWYQGVLSFSDALWEIDVATQSTRLVMSPTALSAPALDMTNLQLSSDNNYLVFINKASGTPWVYRLIDDIPAQPTVGQPASPTQTSVQPSVLTPDMQKIR
jgi:hypothetical protein